MDKNYIERLEKLLASTNDKIKDAKEIEDKSVRDSKVSFFENSKKEIEKQIAEAKASDTINQIGVVDAEFNDKKAPAKKAPAKKPAAKKTESKPVAKKAATKPAAKKTTTKPAAKKTATKPAAKKPATKPTAKKTTAKPVAKKPAAKPAAKKPVAKKATVKKSNDKLVVEYVVVNDVKVPVYSDQLANTKEGKAALKQIDKDNSAFSKERDNSDNGLVNLFEWNPDALIDNDTKIKDYEVPKYEDSEMLKSYESTVEGKQNNETTKAEEVKSDVKPTMVFHPANGASSNVEQPKKEEVKTATVEKTTEPVLTKKEMKAQAKDKKEQAQSTLLKGEFVELDLPPIKDEGVKSLKQINKRQKQLTSKYSKQILEGAVVTTTNYHPNVNDHVIELNGVTKSYLTGDVETQVLKGIDIKLNKQDFIVILGPSGSGKTTFLNTISGLDKATKGDVFVLGYNLSLLKDSHLTKFRRKHVGFIFQQYNLLTNLTAKENAEVGENLSTNKNPDMTIEDIFETIGMKDQMNKYPHQMSGGQQQRVSIARALAKNPDILFADEPTGALDEEMGRKVLEILVDVNRKYNTTVIVVTHNPNIAKIGNTVIHIKNGLVDQVIKNDNPADPQTIDWS